MSTSHDSSDRLSYRYKSGIRVLKNKILILIVEHNDIDALRSLHLQDEKKVFRRDYSSE
jgi:hypothetical protein